MWCPQEDHAGERLSCRAEPIVKNGRPLASQSMHSFLHQYAGSFKKPPLRRPHSVIGTSGLGPYLTMQPSSRLGEASPYPAMPVVFVVTIVYAFALLSRHNGFQAQLFTSQQ